MHAHSLMESSSGAGPTVTAARTTAISTTDVNPLRGRFSWIAVDAWTVRDDRDGGDLACLLLTAVGHPGDPAEQAMPALAEVVGLDARSGAHTVAQDTVYVTLSAERQRFMLHIGNDLTLRGPAAQSWQQTASARGRVRVVIGYRAMAADADGVEHLDDALTGHGVTADVPVRA